MSIDFELKLWDAAKADAQWLIWLELNTEEREQFEPQEPIGSVLEILDQPDAPQEVILGRLAILDLAFGHIDHPLLIENILAFEPFAKFFLVTFSDCPVENGELPSHRLFLHPLYYEKLVNVVTEDVIRSFLTPSMFTGDHLIGMQRLFDPIEITGEPENIINLTNELVLFWQDLQPFFEKAIALDAGRGSVVIIETINSEPENKLLMDRAVQHAEWIKQADHPR